MSQNAKGVLLVALGVVILSPDSLLLRLIETPTASLLFYRGLGIFLVLGSLSLWRYGRRLPARLREGGLVGIGIALAFAVTSVSFVNGVERTSPANVLVYVSAGPLFAAAFSRLLLGERLAPQTLWAILAGMAGVAVTAWGGLAAAGAGGSWDGELFGLAVPIFLGLSFTLMRMSGFEDSWPFYGLSGLAIAGAALLTAPLQPPQEGDLAALALLIFIVSPVSFALISLGPRYIPAPEVSLILLLETILGPLWVWLGVGEAPTPTAWIGGAVILTALALHARWQLRRKPPATTTARA